MSKIPRIERLLNLVSVLFHARAPVPWAEIKGNVVGYDDPAADETLERRFERDKNELRDMGIPVEYTPGDEFSNAGYLVPKIDCFLPAIELGAEDAAILALVGRIAGPALPPELAEHLSSAIRKLCFFAPDEPHVMSTSEERFLFTAAKPSSPSAQPPHLEAVVSAVAQRVTISFRYYAISQDDTRLRTVDPYGVGFHAGHWYVVGRDHERDQVRSFRLDRIRSAPSVASADVLPNGEADFDPPEGFRLADHLGRQPWELPETAGMRGGLPLAAKVRLDPTVAWMVRDNPPRDGQLKMKRDGSAMLTLSTQRPDALVRWILRFGAHAEAMAPQWLRKRCADAARRTAALYTEDGRGKRA